MTFMHCLSFRFRRVVVCRYFVGFSVRLWCCVRVFSSSSSANAAQCNVADFFWRRVFDYVCVCECVCKYVQFASDLETQVLAPIRSYALYSHRKQANSNINLVRQDRKSGTQRDHRRQYSKKSARRFVNAAIKVIDFERFGNKFMCLERSIYYAELRTIQSSRLTSSVFVLFSFLLLQCFFQSSCRSSQLFFVSPTLASARLRTYIIVYFTYATINNQNILSAT